MAKIIGNTTATPNPRPDWNQTDETKADYIKNKPSISIGGDDVNSLVLNDTENNVALGDNSVVAGTGSIAGCKGYYFSTIDFENKKIYLTNEQTPLPTVGVGTVDTSFETPTYSVGKYIGLTNGSHYLFTATIVSIENNVVTYDGDLGFTAMVRESDIDSHVFFVPEEPHIGAFVFTKPGFAFGENAYAIGRGSSAFGRNVIAYNYGSAIGRDTKASAYASAEGKSTLASGAYSHAEGESAVASGKNSHAEGLGTTASGDNSHAEGQNTTASGKNSHAEGLGTTASGIGSYAEGEATEALGHYSHTEGGRTKANAFYAHAEGNNTQALSNNAHSEGFNTIASGESSHAEGAGSYAPGRWAHSEGYCTIASGDGAHSEGIGTTASAPAQHVEGKYNIVDEEGKYAHILGNGTDSTHRSNAHTLDWNGNAWYAGKIKIGGTSYDDPDAKDIMEIKDIGEITTQEQLDNLMLLDEGWTRFETLMALNISDSYDYKVVLDGRTSNYPLVYMVFTIKDANDYIKQYFFNTVTNTGMYPNLFYRGGTTNQENGKYIVRTAAVIYDSNMTDLTLDRLRTNYIQADSGSLTFQGDKFNFDSGEVEFSENVDVSFDGDVSFAKRFMIQTSDGDNLKPVAYSTEFVDSTDAVNIELYLIPSTFNNEYVYGTINSLAIFAQYNPSTDDIVGIHFDTGDIPPTVLYEMQGNGLHLNWIGTDCALDDGISVFAPSANKHYDVYIYNNGTHLLAMVNGFTPATSN